MLLALIALLSASLFTGAALYITLVEQPARLRLDDISLLAQWQPSYKAALPIQAGLAVLGGMIGLIVAALLARGRRLNIALLSGLVVLMVAAFLMP